MASWRAARARSRAGGGVLINARLEGGVVVEAVDWHGLMLPPQLIKDPHQLLHTRPLRPPRHIHAHTCTHTRTRTHAHTSQLSTLRQTAKGGGLMSRGPLRLFAYSSRPRPLHAARTYVQACAQHALTRTCSTHARTTHAHTQHAARAHRNPTHTRTRAHAHPCKHTAARGHGAAPDRRPSPPPRPPPGPAPPAPPAPATARSGG